MVGKILLALLAHAVPCSSAFNTGDTELLYPADSLLNPGALYPLGGKLPPPRVHHTATVVDRYVAVFGGLSTTGEFMDDIHLYDTLVKTWSGTVLKRLCCNDDGRIIEALGADQASIDRLPLLKVGLEGDLPTARAEHSATSMSNNLFVFGGLTADGFMNDMYSFDPAALRWRAVDASLGPLPARRAGHAAVNWGSTRLVVFAGRTGDMLNFTQDTRMLSDVWTFDSSKQRWAHLRPTSNAAPSPRQYAATGVIDSRLYVFGGYDAISDIVFNDVWAFELLSQTWTQLSPNSGAVHGYAPPPLYGSHLIPIVEFDGETSQSVGGLDPDLRYQGFLLYGGAGGGAGCAGKRCDQMAISIGQVYKYEILLDNFIDNSTARIINSDLAASIENPITYNYIKSSHWKYARLARQDNNGEGNADSAFRGKRTKKYVFEAVAFSLDRKIMYEFGGLQAVDDSLIVNGQSVNTRDGVRRAIVPMFMSSGGVIDALPSDLESGERLRTFVDIPFNGVWRLKQAFSLPEREEQQHLEFTNDLRTYRVHPIDIVHIFQESEN